MFLLFQFVGCLYKPLRMALLSLVASGSISDYFASPLGKVFPFRICPAARVFVFFVRGRVIRPKSFDFFFKRNSNFRVCFVACIAATLTLFPLLCMRSS